MINIHNDSIKDRVIKEKGEKKIETTIKVNESRFKTVLE
jgi:hypothetical protein